MYRIRIRIGIRNSFIVLVFANNECAFVQLVHNIEHCSRLFNVTLNSLLNTTESNSIEIQKKLLKKNFNKIQQKFYKISEKF